MADIFDNLHPTLKIKAEQLISKCDKAGLKIRITQGYRSVEEQNELYAQGRTKPGNKVTNARGGFSMHNWGVAFDFCRNDGKGAYNEDGDFFGKVGAIGISIGLEWGGSWKSIVDKPHFQLPDWGSTTSILRSQYKTPEKFFETWKYIDASFNSYGPTLEEAKFRMIKGAYLRTSPEIDKNKMPYNELSATLKKKCGAKSGWAYIKADSIFTRIRSYTDKDGNKWKQMKSGYWVPAVFDGIRRAEQI